MEGPHFFQEQTGSPQERPPKKTALEEEIFNQEGSRKKVEAQWRDFLARRKGLRSKERKEPLNQMEGFRRAPGGASGRALGRL